MEQKGKVYCSTNLVSTLIKTDNRQKLEEFKKIKDNNQKILFCEALLKDHNLIPKFDNFKDLVKKDALKSELYRNQGNKCYREKNFTGALEYYNRRYSSFFCNIQNFGFKCDSNLTFYF